MSAGFTWPFTVSPGSPAVGSMVKPSVAVVRVKSCTPSASGVTIAWSSVGPIALMNAREDPGVAPRKLRMNW